MTTSSDSQRRTLPRRLVVGAVVVVIVTLVAAGLLVTRHHQSSGAAAAVVLADEHSCVMSGHPHPGAQLLTVKDLGVSPTEVAIFGSGATSTQQFGQIEDVGPGTTVLMPVTLGPGTFTLVCEPGRTDENPITSSFVTAGAGPPVQGVVPTTDADFTAPETAYKGYVADQLGSLSQGLVGLRAEVARGDRAGAEADYPVVHANYERIGAVYDAFGDTDAAINGLADGLPQGEADPAFTGFHKFEAQLWGAAPTTDLLASLDQLSTNVDHLEVVLSLVVIDSLTYATRAHEILENALQEQVTGLAEPHSHSGIDDTAASVAGAQEVVNTLRSLLQRQDSRLVPRIDGGFTRLTATLKTLQSGAATYLPDNTLTTGQREQLTAAISSLLEQLAQIPGLLTPPQDPRDTSEH